MMSTDDQLETTNCGSSGHVTDDVKLPERVKVATPKCLRLNILVTMRDSYLASTDHQSERTVCGSSGHVTNDVT